MAIVKEAEAGNEMGSNVQPQMYRVIFIIEMNAQWSLLRILSKYCAVVRIVYHNNGLMFIYAYHVLP